MNLAFFLTPVADVAWMLEDTPVVEAIAAMRQHRYTAVPLLDHDRHYVGTITAADLLHWTHEEGDPGTLVADLPRAQNRAVTIDTDIRGILTLAADQNFVPVVDSRAVLMGIVTRKAILAFFEQLLGEHGLLPDGG